MTRSTLVLHRWALVLVAVVGVATACEQPPPTAPTRGFDSVRATPTPTSTPIPILIPSPTPVPEGPLVQFLGAVSDEDGMPLIGASVQIEYQVANGQHQWKEVRTIEGGRYSAHLPARANAQLYSQPNALAVVYSYHTGYDWNVQIVNGNASENEVEFRLNRPRLIEAGASFTVPVDRQTSLCTDLEWNYNFKARCADFSLSAKTSGTVTIEVLSVSPGGVVPNIQVYAGSYLEAPGTISFPVTAGKGPSWIRIEVPVTAGAQQYQVVTSIK